VNGLALVLLLCGRYWASESRKDDEWLEYLLLGTAYPAMLLALALLSRRERPGWTVPATVECGLAPA